VQINFKKPHDIQYINIIVNGSKIDTMPLLSNGYMLLEISEPIIMIVDDDYIIQKKLSLGEDIRKLSVYIDRIQIISADKDQYYDYSLADVL
jgi:hypothetical protein